MRGIVAFEHRLLDKWLGRIPDALLVSGLNGSGKTTVLDAIFALWKRFGFALDGSFGPGEKSPSLHRFLLLSCRLAAVKLEGLSSHDPRPVWLFAAHINEWNELKPSLEGCHFAGIIHNGKGGIRLEFSDQAWAKDWQRNRKESMVTGRGNAPNIVYVNE